MKIIPLVIAISAAVGFGSGLAAFYWHGGTSSHYQIVSGGQTGNAFRLDTRSGDTWLITPTGEEKLALPSAPEISLETIKAIYQQIRQSNPKDTPATLRGYAIQMHNLTGTSAYDAAALRSSD